MNLQRQQEDLENSNQAVIVSQASTATITEVTINTDPDLLSPLSTQAYQRLKEKLARYTYFA